MYLNSWEFQRISSSHREDRDMATIDASKAISVTKSLEPTESIEFSVGSRNPRRSDVIFLSMGYVVPARAADPRGHLFILSKASRNLSASLPKRNAWAIM